LKMRNQKGGLSLKRFQKGLGKKSKKLARETPEKGLTGDEKKEQFVGPY